MRAASDLDASQAAPARSGAAPIDTSEPERARLIAKRRWPRVAVDMPVHVRVTTQGPTRTLTCEGHGMDLSCGGLAVVVDIDLLVGDQINVEFIPPNTPEPAAFRGFVRNRHGNKYGVEFITENDRDYQKTGELQLCIAKVLESVSR